MAVDVECTISLPQVARVTRSIRRSTASPETVTHSTVATPPAEGGEDPRGVPLSKKSDLIQDLVKKVKLPNPLPDPGVEGTLLERGMYAVLLRELPETRARSAVAALRSKYEDYNETRVSQAQEIALAIAPKGKGLERLGKYLPAARLVKQYLQAIFQEVHGLDLEGLGEDPVGVGRQLASIDMLGAAVTSYLLFVSEGGELPVLAGNVRVLDRINAMSRTSSVRKARELLNPLIKPQDRLSVSYTIGLVADQWCDSRKPVCWECPFLDACPNGKKVFKDWKVQQERLAKQRKKEEARAVALAKKEEARAKRDAEREAKAQLAAEKKRLKERQRLEKAKAKQDEIRRKKLAAEKAAEQKKAAAKKAAKKKAPAKKKAAKVTKKKAPKVTKKKAPAKKKAAATKKAAKKPAASKKTAKKKATKKKAKGRR
jgi:adenine-specific DNA glycosylase